MNIIDSILDKNLFAPWFSGSSWRAWLTFLRVLFGLPLDEDDALIFERHTKRTTAPQNAFRESWLVVGRRGGKSLVASLVAVFLACFRDYGQFLKPGEVGTIAIIAADRRQARTILRYIRGFFELPILKKLVVNDTQEQIELSNRVTIEVHTASFRSVRGYTLLGVIADELAFWRSDESANPDKEIIAAVKPGLSTIPGALLLCISSPYARRGSLWEAYQRHFGKDSPVLVWQAATREMNPSIDQGIIDQALEEDEPTARAEYFAEFRRDIEAFISREAIDACVVRGRLELAPVSDVRYSAFVDPSGGSSDSMTLGIAHADKEVVIVDAVREIKAPFSPEAAVKEFAEFLKTYRVSSVTGDRYAGEWPREQFRKYGITYKTSELNKSELYLATLPLLNSGRVELLDSPRLLKQLLDLERRTSRAGRDSIDHGPGGHDDVANAAAGVISITNTKAQQRSGMRKMDGETILPAGFSSLSELRAHQAFERRLREYYESPTELEAATLFISGHPERTRWLKPQQQPDSERDARNQ